MPGAKGGGNCNQVCNQNPSNEGVKFCTLVQGFAYEVRAEDKGS